MVDAPLNRALIAETTSESRTKADAALNRVLRNDEDGRAIFLHIRDLGLVAIEIEPEAADSAPTSADEELSQEPGPDPPT